jgi:hypothetical protein
MDEEGGATRVELRVTASFRIFSASFQCTVSTNFDTARSRSKYLLQRWSEVGNGTGRRYGGNTHGCGSGSALIWLSRIQIFIGNADPDPGAWN